MSKVPVFDASRNIACSSVGMAARNGDVDALKALLEEGRCVDVADNRGFRPLHEAAARDHDSSIRLLVENENEKTDFDWKTFEGETALCLAAKFGSYRSLQLLLEAGADLNVKTLAEESPLHYAVSEGQEKCARTLLKFGASVNDPDWDDWTPLHRAAADGRTNMVQLLLDNGADCNLTEKSARLTPLYLAAQNGCLGSLHLLISAGSDVNTRSRHMMSAVHSAVQGVHVGCLEQLLLAGADSNVKDQNDLLPLHIALTRNLPLDIKRMVELLLPHCDRDVVARCLVSPVTLALWRRHYDLAGMLISSGVGVNSRVCSSGCPSPFHTEELPMRPTPLHMAAYLGRPHLLRALLEAGAHPNLKVTSGCALAEACISDDVEACHPMVEALLDHGACLGRLERPDYCCHICRIEMRLAHLIACNDGSYRVIKLLLDRGLPPDRLSLNCALPSDNLYMSLCPHLERGAELVLLKLDYTERFPACPEFLRKAKDEKWPLYDKIQAILDNPRPLKHLCRLKIRSILGVAKLQKTKFILSLPLPKMVLDYLLYT